MEYAEMYAAVAPLLIGLFQELCKDRSNATEEDFRTWLRENAMPELMDTTTTAYRTLLISQKVHHRDLRDLLDERFAELRFKFDEIRNTRPRIPTPEERWQALGVPATTLMNLLMSQTTADTFDDAQLAAPFLAEAWNDADVKIGIDRLVEAGLVTYETASGAAFFAAHGAGLFDGFGSPRPRDVQSGTVADPGRVLLLRRPTARQVTRA